MFGMIWWSIVVLTVEELSDQEVLLMVPDYVDFCERSDINVNMDEARDLAMGYLFGLEMERCA